jgi:hypothetical protein
VEHSVQCQGGPGRNSSWQSRAFLGSPAGSGRLVQRHRQYIGHTQRPGMAGRRFPSCWNCRRRLTVALCRGKATRGCRGRGSALQNCTSEVGIIRLSAGCFAAPSHSMGKTVMSCPEALSHSQHSLLCTSQSSQLHQASSRQGRSHTGQTMQQCQQKLLLPGCQSPGAAITRPLAPTRRQRARSSLLVMQAAAEQQVAMPAPPAQQPSPTQFLRPHLLKLAPYTPIEPFEVLSARYGRSPQDIVKLDANENPYGPPPEVLQALSSMPFPHIYPDPETRQLRAALAEWNDIPAEHLLVSRRDRAARAAKLGLPGWRGWRLFVWCGQAGLGVARECWLTGQRKYKQLRHACMRASPSGPAAATLLSSIRACSAAHQLPPYASLSLSHTRRSAAARTS